MLSHAIRGVFALVFLIPVAQAKSVTIRWHGQSFFEIKTSTGTVIATDPHNLEAYGKRAVAADLVLVSHFHIDHTSMAPITNMKAKVINGLKNKFGARGDRKDDEFNVVDEKVKDIHIQSIPCYHDDMNGLVRGKNTVFIIDVDGLRIVHLGDLGHKLSKAQLEKLGKVDVLMIPVGGVYTINGSEAKEIVAQIKPTRYVVPMHYGTDVYDFLLGPAEFLDEQDEKTIKKIKDNELVVDADVKVKEGTPPTIAMLYHKPKEKEKEKEKE